LKAQFYLDLIPHLMNCMEQSLSGQGNSSADRTENPQIQWKCSELNYSILCRWILFN